MEEDRALEQLSRVLVKVNEQQAVRDQSARMLVEEMNYFEQKHRDDFSIEFFQMYDRYIERLQQEDRSAAEKLEEMRPDLETARGKVVEASKKKRIVEQLKERHRERYLEEVRKAERKELEQYNLLRGNAELTQASNETIRTEYESARTLADDEPEESLDREREQAEEDLIGQYYRNLGLPDPRVQ